jgi:hypothetical protein
MEETCVIMRVDHLSRAAMVYRQRRGLGRPGKRWKDQECVLLLNWKHTPHKEEDAVDY